MYGRVTIHGIQWMCGGGVLRDKGSNVDVEGKVPLVERKDYL